MNAKRIRNGRRLTALLLCLLLMLSGAPLQALAAEAQTDVVTCTDPTNRSEERRVGKECRL